MAAQNFETVYQRILRDEGGLSTRTAATGDPGGRTYKGITQGVYDSYRSNNGLPRRDVLQIGNDEHRTLTRSQYWDRIGGDDLPAGLDYSLMDVAFNAGVGRAGQILRTTLGLPRRGDANGLAPPDANDLALAAFVPDQERLVQAFTRNRDSKYREFHNYDQNPGWQVRLPTVGRESLEMAREAARQSPGFEPNGSVPDARRFDYVTTGIQQGFEDSFAGDPANFVINGAENPSFGTSVFDPIARGVGSARDDVAGALTRGSDAITRALEDAANGAANAFSGFFRPSEATGSGSGGVGANGTGFGTNSPPGVTVGGSGTGGIGAGGSGSGGLDARPSLSSTTFSGNFDPAGYLAANPDVARDAAFAQNPFNHYLQYGQAEGRDLSPEAGIQRAAPGAFDFSGRNVSAAVGAGSLGSGVGSMGSGSAAGGVGAGGSGAGSLNPATFNATAYLAANPDVGAAGVGAFEHYLNHGLREGRAIDQAGTRFDPSRYASQNADVLAAGMDPLMHYAQFGAFEGRAAPLVGPNGTAPLVMSFGLAPTVGPNGATQFRAPDGVTFSRAADGAIQPIAAPSATPTIGANTAQRSLPPGFSEQGYYIANPDVAAAGIPAAQHYQQFGIQEGRQIGPTFSEEAYYQANPDVAAAGIPAAEHYANFGIREGRTLGAGNVAPLIGPNAAGTIGAGQAVSGLPPGFDFNAQEYLRANPDVQAAGMDPLAHFTRYGFDEGRALNTQGLRLADNFDGTAYLARNPDVAAAGLNPLQHFLDFGSAEGRQATIGNTPYSWSQFNTSQGVPNGSFGTGIQSPPGLTAAGSSGAGVGASLAGAGAASPSPINASASGKGGVGASAAGGGAASIISPTGFSGQNVSQGVGMGSFGSPSAISSALGLGMGGQAPGTVSPYGFGGDVSGFNPGAVGGGNVSGFNGAVGAVGGFNGRPGFGGYVGGPNSGQPGARYGDGPVIQAQNSQRSQQNFLAYQANDLAQRQNEANALNFNLTNVGAGGVVATAPRQIFNPEFPTGTANPPAPVQFSAPNPPIGPSPQVANNIAQGAAAQANFFARTPQGGLGGGAPPPLPFFGLNGR